VRDEKGFYINPLHQNANSIESINNPNHLYKITISNPENRSKGVKQIYVNEKLIDGTTIEPLKLSNEVNVKVIMG